MDGKCIPRENVKILLWSTALYVAYTSKLLFELFLTLILPISFDMLNTPSVFKEKVQEQM